MEEHVPRGNLPPAPPGEEEKMLPPRIAHGPVGWLRANLFSSPLNAILTILALWLLWSTVPPLVNWAVADAVVSGERRGHCDIGRSLSGVAEGMERADLQRLDGEDTQDALQDAQDYLAQFEGQVTARDADVPPRVAELLAERPVKPLQTQLQRAVEAGDPTRIASVFEALAPLAAWGERHDGACWTFVKVWFPQFMYGFYPAQERWRINLALVILVLWAAPLFVRRVPGKTWIGGSLLVLYPIIAYFLFTGGIFGLPVVETARWGGLFLNLVVSSVGIVASLPLGILLALGRRSHMPIVQAICVAFIELWRGVPLITVLFMASVMFPLFLPEGVNFDKLLRALVGVALFSSAYMAEVVRGGLQAIPKGQYEAAEALGLTYWKSRIFIVLPQALRLVIPGIVNTFISLLKDTTLVAIIGLLELLGMVQSALRNSYWLGLHYEGYVFAAFWFWILCFAISRYSQRVERRLAVGHQH